MLAIRHMASFRKRMIYDFLDGRIASLSCLKYDDPINKSDGYFSLVA